VKYVRYGFQRRWKIIQENKKRNKTKARVVCVEMSRMILVKKTFSDFTVPESGFDPLTLKSMRCDDILYIYTSTQISVERREVVYGKKLQIFLD